MPRSTAVLALFYIHTYLSVFARSFYFRLSVAQIFHYSWRPEVFQLSSAKMGATIIIASEILTAFSYRNWVRLGNTPTMIAVRYTQRESWYTRKNNTVQR